MDNLSQNNETSLETLKNNEIEEQFTFIPYILNNFRLYGMVSNDLEKKYQYGKIVSKIELKVPGGTIAIVWAFGKKADEVVTIYKKGDWVYLEGQISSKINEDKKLINYYTLKEHMIVKRNLNFQSINQHEFNFKETEQLYDPFKVKERMLEGEDDNNGNR